MTYHEEIERHFQSLRGTQCFMLSTSDWGLLSKWQLNSIPLVCVLRGLTEAFRKHEGRRLRHETINSVAYCTGAVLEEWKQYRKRVA